MNLLLTFLIACGGGDTTTQSTETPQATEVAGETEETEETETTTQEDDMSTTDQAWPIVGDGIPEIDESGATTTESGLTIIPMGSGGGAQPSQGDLVAVHYHGWLADGGKLFDSSGSRGEPITFPVGTGMVIPGWDEGVASMNVGDKARLRIPAAIAYGERAMGEDIPANSDLVFDVWLTGSFAAPSDGIPEIDETNSRTTESGLTIITTQAGTGDVVGTKVASVHYAGWLRSEGTLFDSSIPRGRPIQFPVGRGQVIPGWDEGVGQMKVGEMARLIIPWNLAYGEAGRGPIPAQADLVFDVWVVGAMEMPAGRH